MTPTPLDVVMIVVVGVAILVSLIGTVLPAFPGLILAWAATGVYGLVTGFDVVGTTIFALITLLTATAYVLLVRIPQKATEARGASRWSTVVGAIGAITGFFLVPVVGFVVGGVAGVYGAEYARTRRASQAWNATKGVLVGFGISTALQLAAGVMIGVLWFVWVVLRFDPP